LATHTYDPLAAMATGSLNEEEVFAVAKPVGASAICVAAITKRPRMSAGIERIRSNGCIRLFQYCSQSVKRFQETSGADDRARTGDLDLGKVALYQLSYVRVVNQL
jgi:hypothetical protein